MGDLGKGFLLCKICYYVYIHGANIASWCRERIQYSGFLRAAHSHILRGCDGS